MGRNQRVLPDHHNSFPACTRTAWQAEPVQLFPGIVNLQTIRVVQSNRSWRLINAPTSHQYQLTTGEIFLVVMKLNTC